MVEVADSTLRYDSEIKLPLYARFGIPTCWIVDLEHRELRVCTDPAEGGYQTCQTIQALSRVGIPALPGLVADLSRLF